MADEESESAPDAPEMIGAPEVDPETTAISLVGYALQSLDLDAAKRVLAWADQRYVRNQVYDGATAALAEATERLMKLTTRAEAAGLSKEQVRGAILGGDAS